MNQLNGIKVKTIEPMKGYAATVLVPLPESLWVLAGKCACVYCSADKMVGVDSFWDTLAVSPGNPHTWTVHAPELQGKRPLR